MNEIGYSLNTVDSWDSSLMLTDDCLGRMSLVSANGHKEIVCLHTEKKTEPLKRTSA